MADRARESSPFDDDLDSDDAILRDFPSDFEPEEPGSSGAVVHPAVLRSAAWSPYAYAAMLNQLLDEGLSDLGAPAARLLLQLVRETFGRGERQATLSLRDLRRVTGLFDSSLLRSIDELEHRELITVIKGTSHRASSFTVDLSTLLKNTASVGPIRRFSIEYRLEDLTDADRNDLITIERALMPSVRKEIALEVRLQFQSLGQQIPDRDQFRQACRYLVLEKHFSPARLKKSYPNWFARPEE